MASPKQNVSTELYYSSAWNLITSKTRVSDGLTILRGDGDESAALRPSSTTGALDNTTEVMNPRNPMSPLYGVAGRYAPLRVTVDGVVRNVTEINSWKPARTLGYARGANRGDYVTGIESGGLLYRLGQSSDPIHSAVYRRMTRVQAATGHLLGYWPMEDARASTALTSAGTTAAAATFSGVTLGGTDCPGGSDGLMQLSATAAVVGTFVPNATSGWQVSFMFKLDSDPGATSIPLVSWTTNNGYTWSVSVNSTAFHWDVTDSSGASLLSAGTTYGSDTSPIGQWVMMRYKGSVSAGTVTYAPTWYAENSPFRFSTSGTFAGSVGNLLSWTITGNAAIDQAFVGHLYGMAGTTDDLLSVPVLASFNGFNEETAGDRFERLCTEEGISYTTIGDTADTVVMGPQRPDTLTNLFREIRDTDDALLYDTQTEIGLTFRTRVDRYNQAVALALVYSSGHLSEGLQEVVDILDLHDDVVVQQRDGGQYGTSVASPTQPAQTIGVNVTDEAYWLPLLGGWWLNRGTVDETRYPTVVVDLVANPGLATTAAGIDIGDRITLAGVEYDTADMYVIGIAETIGSHTRTITFTCKPYREFDPALYVTSGATPTQVMKRYDSRTSTLNASYSTTASPMVITFTDLLDAWSTTAVPYDWAVAGERITVTAMGAVTGAGPYTQSATVTRSVNGVVKAQTSGSAVHMHPDQQARYAL